MTAKLADINEITENFSILDDWDDRYRYLIELGRELPPLSAAAHSDANKVQGCASQVWLDTTVRPNGADGPVLTFEGDSDAHIVRGLIAILLATYSGRTAKHILATDAVKLFEGLGRSARTAFAPWWSGFAPTPARRSRPPCRRSF
jgi:cysteine desulfuration protein SufE